MYITQSEYQAISFNAATISAADFAKLEGVARSVLDSWTWNRITEPYSDAVKRVMATIIDVTYAANMDGDLVKSYSNGQDSFSFDVSGKTEQDRMHAAYKMALNTLPVSLTSRVFDEEVYHEG